MSTSESTSALPRLLDPWLRDVRHAARALRRTPGFTATALVTLALCIGANAAIFSMLYTLALKSLPFPAAGQLIEITNNYPKSGLLQAPCTVQQYLDYRAHADAFSELGLYRQFGTAIEDGQGVLRVNIARVTFGFFAALGVEPLLGNFFAPEDSTWGNDRKLVLTESFWRTHYAADPDIVGRTVKAGSAFFTIVGVAPRAIEVIDPTVKVIKPTVWRDSWVSEMNRHTKAYALVGRMFGRLKPGATLDGARLQLETLDQRFYASASSEYRGFVDGSGHTLSLQPMRDGMLGAAKTRLYLLQTAALLVLLIGCINLTHLLLVRAGAREADLALRSALGGSRGAIARQWCLEPLLLTCVGGLAGIGVAWAGIKLINRYALPFLPRVEPFTLDWPVAAFSLALCAASVAGIALIPLRDVLRTNLMSVLRRGTVNTAGRSRGRAFRTLLVPVQVALSLVLVTSAGLLIRSFFHVATLDPGFETRQLVTVRTVLENTRRQNAAGVAQLQAAIFAALRALPGVEAVGMASITPLHEEYPLHPVHVRGAAVAPGGVQPMVRILPIMGDFFPALGVPLRSGRWLDARDDSSDLRTLLIDERAAEQYFAGADPVGRQIALGSVPERDDEWWTIVGVVGYANYQAIDEVGGLPFCYLPEPKYPMAGNSYFVRSTRSADEILPVMRTTIRGVDPTLEQYHAGAMDDFASTSLDNRRALGLFAGLFAALALFLAVLGIYGVMAVEVAQRTREIGIRCAVGASRPDILRLILLDSGARVTFGIAAGVAGSLLTGRLLATSLFGVPPHDPFTLTTAAGLLLLAALLASAVPALRAARIDPARALRVD